MQRFREFIKTNWPYIFITSAPLILFAPFLLGGVVLYWGTPFFQFYPWRKFAFDMIRTGQLPLWNPYLGNGTPLIANYQSAIFYPPNWLSLILPLAYSFSWLVALHLILAGAGMVTFTRSLGIKPFGQAVAGLAFGMSQYLVTRAGFLSINAAVAWLPWMIWAADKFLLSEKKSGGHIFCFTLFAALQLLAGHAQTTWYTYLLLAAWALYRLFANRIHFSRLVILAASLILAVGVAALQLIPTAEFLSQSQRSGEFGYEAAMVYSYSPARLITLLAPDFFGNPAREIYFGYGNYWEDANYIGILPLMLAIGLLFSRIKFPRRSEPEPDSVKPILPNSMIAFLAGTILVSFLLGLGSNTPIFPFLYHYMPTFNMFQAPTRIMIWFEFCLALLAGLAADEWTPPEDKKLYWTRLGLMGAITLMLIGLSIYFVFPSAGKIGGQIHTMAGASTFTGFLLTISTIFALTQPVPDSPRHTLWTILVVGFIALDLIYANWGLNPPAPPDIYTSQPASFNSHRAFEYGVDYTYFLNFESFGSPALAVQAHAFHLTDTNMLDGISSVNNYDPLKENRFTKFLNALYQHKQDSVLQLADVGTIISGENKSALRLEQAAKTPSRVWAVTSSTTVANADAALTALFADTFDPARSVILEENDPGTTAAHSVPFEAAQSSSAPSIIESQPNDVKINASMPQAGWVVLSDTYYPGWFVYVDGQPAKMLHADYAFRGVAVPAGIHRVEFIYEPFSFKLGGGITGISIFIFIGLIFGYKKFSGRSEG